MRGRLINPFAAELAQLDTAATAADPDGPGPLTSGYDADFQETVLFHFGDLEQLGLVDPTTGDALLRPGDRLVAIRDLRTGDLVQAIRTPPGLYLTEAQPQSFGLGGRRNLLLATFSERALGPQGGS